jgi:hypothetical protein
VATLLMAADMRTPIEQYDVNVIDTGRIPSGGVVQASSDFAQCVTRLQSWQSCSTLQAPLHPPM